MNYKNKYLKYKLKYLTAKKLYGGVEYDQFNTPLDEQFAAAVQTEPPEITLSEEAEVDMRKQEFKNVLNFDNDGQLKINKKSDNKSAEESYKKPSKKSSNKTGNKSSVKKKINKKKK